MDKVVQMCSLRLVSSRERVMCVKIEEIRVSYGLECGMLQMNSVISGDGNSTILIVNERTILSFDR